VRALRDAAPELWGHCPVSLPPTLPNRSLDGNRGRDYVQVRSSRIMRTLRKVGPDRKVFTFSIAITKFRQPEKARCSRCTKVCQDTAGIGRRPKLFLLIA